jgi:hypothetical protein
VDPAYQRRQLGTKLTQHCNRIADEAGAKTFAGARPSSRKMFEQNGFNVVYYYYSDMTKFPDIEDDHRADNWLLIREPQKL